MQDAVNGKELEGILGELESYYHHQYIDAHIVKDGRDMYIRIVYCEWVHRIRTIEDARVFMDNHPLYL